MTIQWTRYLDNQLTDFTFTTLLPSLWREILLMVLTGGWDVGLPAAYKCVNDALSAEISALREELKGSGQVRADRDVDLASFCSTTICIYSYFG
ncbi:hypothetical protein JFU49_20400 [Pseudomonas sp. TH03]|uniref:hypothetical protein n=1 Tax=Pseudomonas sp. TH03 TaxID=2796369 RepID=UPI0019118FCA|nr:hypothetical protein [Pseudomonas sp. TH03]MBK5552621.1 hypothetical protein [Pseudomonas sp. TH03]